MKYKKAILYCALAFCLAVGGASVFVWKKFISPPWEEEYAYTKGMQAATYAFPYVLNSSLRWAWSQPKEVVNSDTVPSDAVNNFFHAKRLMTADYRDGATPNNDTAYSFTWAYVGNDPLILSVPEIGTVPGSDKPRYYSFQFVGFDSDNFAYVGTRTTGNQAGNYAVVPKGWQGTLPAGVTLLAETPTPWFMILGRTLVLDVEDFPAVSQLINKYQLISLSDWGSATPKRPYAPKLEPVPHYKKDKLGLATQFWDIANKAMTENPPAAVDARLMTFFQDINVGPGRDTKALSEGMQAGLARASLRTLMLLPEVNKSPYGTTLVNGWKYPPKNFGRTGPDGQHLLRAALQSYAAVLVNDPEENIYLPAWRDVNGTLFNGKTSYKMTFAKGNTPPVNAFWSLTMYDDTNNLARNEINRYSLGDRTPGLKYAEDGSLTLYIGEDKPADELLSNWLPAPPGDFYLVIRAYFPKPALFQQTWQPPIVEPVDSY